MALPRKAHHSRGMTIHSSSLDSIASYLRFPLAADHRAPLQDGRACPRCGATCIQKWGGFAGRKRYRCSACLRTFSTFTNTALHHLKHPDRWRRFLWCIDGRLTVRTSAAVLGVSKDTALRWRHRLLAQWALERKPRLTGHVVMGDFCMPHSDKGSRSLDRPARRHGEPWSFASDQTGPVTIVVALERDRAQLSPMQRSAAMVLQRAGVGRRITLGDYDHHIAPRLHGVTEIVGCGGMACTVARFAARQGVRYRMERRSFFPREVFEVRRELRHWLRPFRGVSTRWLDQYMEWFRRRRGLRGSPQQFPRTEPDRLSRSTQLSILGRCPDAPPPPESGSVTGQAT